MFAFWRIPSRIIELERTVKQMAANFAALQALVTQETSVVQSVIAVVNGAVDVMKAQTAKIQQLIAAAAGGSIDPAALQAAVDEMTADNQKLSDAASALANATVANTPNAITPAP